MTDVEGFQRLVDDYIKRIRTGMSKANDRQEGGTHYRKMAIQPWDFILANGIGFCEGNAIAYLCRWKDKHGIEDLRKAAHFIQKLIETEEAKIPGNR